MKHLDRLRRWPSWTRRLKQRVLKQQLAERARITDADALLDERARVLDRDTESLDVRRDALVSSEERATSTLEMRMRHREADVDTRERGLETREGALVARSRVIDDMASEAAGSAEATRTRLERELLVLDLESRTAHAERRACAAEAERDGLAAELARARASV